MTEGLNAIGLIDLADGQTLAGYILRLIAASDAICKGLSGDCRLSTAGS